MLYGRQHECRCFPRSGLRQTKEITPLKNRRYGLLLDRCWCGIAAALNCIGNVGVEIKIVKTHNTPAIKQTRHMISSRHIVAAQNLATDRC